MWVTDSRLAGLKPAGERSNILVFSGGLLGAADNQFMAGNFPAVAGAYKVGQIGRPQGEHGAFAILNNVQGLHIRPCRGRVARDGRQLRAHKVLGRRKCLQLAFY